MITRTISGMALVMILGASFVNLCQADDQGVARTSTGTAWSDGQPVYMVAPQTQYQVPNPTYWTYMPKPFAGVCEGCGNPNCPGKHGVWTFPAVRWVLDPDYYAVSPDYGWAVPSQRPVIRRPVTYQKYAPEMWYGQQTNGKPQMVARYPVIAQPTDTSQSGYYYQQVPTWQPRRILPPAPHPRDWHIREGVPGPDMTYTRWVPIRNAWVPLNQIPSTQPTTVTPEAVPMPATPAPVIPKQEVLPPAPAEEKAHPPVPADKGPEALDQGDGTFSIRRVGL